MRLCGTGGLGLLSISGLALVESVRDSSTASCVWRQEAQFLMRYPGWILGRRGCPGGQRGWREGCCSHLQPSQHSPHTCLVSAMELGTLQVAHWILTV